MIVIPFTLGPIENNTYLVADPSAGHAVVVDPSFDPEPVLAEAKRRQWVITGVWLTHAHFDHIAGIQALRSALGPQLRVALHPDDLPLWRENGGANLFGMSFEAGPEPNLLLRPDQTLALGMREFSVFHTPGHSPGHCVFYSQSANLAFTGDLIFYRAVGRTDLPGCSSLQLTQSIQEKIYTLPPETRLFPGHGPATTVGDEVRENPYV